MASQFEINHILLKSFLDKKRPCWQIWQQQAASAWSAAAWNAWNVHFSPFCHFNYSPVTAPSPQQVSSEQNRPQI